MSAVEAKLRLTDLQSGKWENKDFISSYLNFYTLDQSDLKQIVSVADKFKATHQQLDVILANAGIWVTKECKSKQDYPMTFAVNHLSHMLLVDNLFELLNSTPNSRVVNVSSIAHKPTSAVSKDPFVELGDMMNLKAKKFDGNQDYAESKFANVVFTNALDIYFKEKNCNVKTVSLHPGVIASGLYRDFGACCAVLMNLSVLFMMTEFEGA